MPPPSRRTPNGSGRSRRMTEIRGASCVTRSRSPLHVRPVAAIEDESAEAVR